MWGVYKEVEAFNQKPTFTSEDPSFAVSFPHRFVDQSGLKHTTKTKKMTQNLISPPYILYWEREAGVRQ